MSNFKISKYDLRNLLISLTDFKYVSWVTIENDDIGVEIRIELPEQKGFPFDPPKITDVIVNYEDGKTGDAEQAVQKLVIGDRKLSDKVLGNEKTDELLTLIETFISLEHKHIKELYENEKYEQDIRDTDKHDMGEV